MNEFDKYYKDIADIIIYEDGIINSIEYNKNSNGQKLLFIAKEPNANKHDDDDKKRSFITEWNELKPDYPFAIRIAEWAYGILNNFPTYEEAKSHSMDERYLSRIAFMNYKKTGGKGLSSEAEFIKLASMGGYNELLNEQIKQINPDIIILGLSWDSLILKLFPTINWKKSGYGVDVGRLDSTRVIKFYHPSSRNVPSASYSLLQNVFQSEIFKNL